MAYTNQAKSFFSRLRRAEMGVHHRISGADLGAYAGEMTWREDHHRESNGVQYLIGDERRPHAPRVAPREGLLAEKIILTVEII